MSWWNVNLLSSLSFRLFLQKKIKTPIRSKMMTPSTQPITTAFTFTLVAGAVTGGGLVLVGVSVVGVVVDVRVGPGWVDVTGLVVVIIWLIMVLELKTGGSKAVKGLLDANTL
jgi:hypothetical protein